jgi:hypothetical protein
VPVPKITSTNQAASLRPIHLTGGAVSPALIRAKQKWMRLARYVPEQDSSTKGAALLARLHLHSPKG